jgi:hypothetical protein
MDNITAFSTVGVSGSDSAYLVTTTDIALGRITPAMCMGGEFPFAPLIIFIPKKGPYCKSGEQPRSATVCRD